jgi:hypothetical protein
VVPPRSTWFSQMRASKLSPFRTRGEIERYFGGKTIKCLICGRRLKRLAFHLAVKHDMSPD